MRPAGALRINGSNSCVSATTEKKFVSNVRRTISRRHRACRVEAVPEIKFLQLDAGIVNQDVEPAVAPFQVFGNLLVVLRTSHIEAHGLDALDALGPERVGGGTPLGLVSAAHDDYHAEFTQLRGQFQIRCPCSHR